MTTEHIETLIAECNRLKDEVESEMSIFSDSAAVLAFKQKLQKKLRKQRYRKKKEKDR